MSVLNSAARSAYDIAFQVSPIILTGGNYATPTPIIALVGQAGAFVQGALTSGFSMQDFYARFVPLPGGTVVANAIGLYPFANQNVASNAIVRQPLTVSLRMIAPVKETGGYLTKLAVFTALQQALQTHNLAGGLYDIATPSYVYADCVMVAMTDITGGETAQQQIEWQLDFMQPLVTASESAAAQSSLMGKIANGQQTDGSTAPASSPTIGGALSGLSQKTGALLGTLEQAIPGTAL